MKKSDRTIEEARKIWIDQTEYSLKRFKEMAINPLHKTRVAYNWDIKLIENQISVLERQIRMVKKGLCNIAVLNAQPEVCTYIPEKGFYIDCDKYHDPFRIGKYTEHKLFSYQECLEYIANYEKDINRSIDIHESLYQFWEEFPDGMIEFG
jgi:hypothetical protein